MGLILRKLDNRRRWDKINPPWLKDMEGEIPADPMWELRTKENNLSVYYIKEDRSNLNDVIAAHAATRNAASEFDYLLFDEEICSSLKIVSKDTLGTTPDKEVNQKWHRDLIELSADKLLKLAKSLYDKGEIKKKYSKEIITMIAKASLANKIPIQSINSPILREKVKATPLWKTASSS